MKFVTKSNSVEIVKAMNLFNEIVRTRAFSSMVEHCPGSGIQYVPFSNTTGWNINIFLQAFIKQEADIEIELWKPWNPWSKAIAMFDKKYPYTIYLNSRKINRTTSSLVGSIAHEFIHLLDNQSVTLSFGHEGNSSKGKSLSAPYYIGHMTNTLVKEQYQGR